MTDFAPCTYKLVDFDTEGRQVVCARPAIRRVEFSPDDGYDPMYYCQRHWAVVEVIPEVTAGKVEDVVPDEC